MTFVAAERVADAVLYEGYLLYPYRASAAKNRMRFQFGVLHPRTVRGERSAFRAECLVDGDASSLRTRLRYLDTEGEAVIVDDGVPLATETVGGYVRITADVVNASHSPMAAAHLLLAVEPPARFVSLFDPPDGAPACENDGVWPVLAGPPGDDTVMLCSPIILYDHPQVAPESPGDWYDATEVDELLALRVMTLTDEEKAEARATDPRAAAIVDRAERLTAADMARLHGASVVLRPRRRADAMDMFLEGRRATVEGVFEDLDGEVHVAVTVDDDPAKDLHGWYGRYFYFRPDEVEAGE